MPDSKAQKNMNPSQPAGSQDKKKPETAPKDNKSSYGNDNKSDKNATGGSSSGIR